MAQYYIRQLKDAAGNIILPATRAAGVFFDDNTKLQDIMSGTSGVVAKALGDKNGKDLSSYIADAQINDHKITLTKGDGTPVEITVPDNDTTYSEATTSDAGLMSAADKTKLDGLDTALAGKANAEHDHTMSDITDLTTMAAATAEAAGAAGLVPAPQAGDQGKFLTGAGTWSSVTLATFGVTASATEINYLTGVTSAVQTQLDGKAAAEHTHEIADVTDLQTTLDGKAAVEHSHEISEIEGLSDQLQQLTGGSITVDNTWGAESTALPAWPAEEDGEG